MKPVPNNKKIPSPYPPENADIRNYPLPLLDAVKKMHARELENAQRLCKEETSCGDGKIAESTERAAESDVCSASAGSGGCSGCATGTARARARGGTSRGGGSQRADRHRRQGCIGVSWDSDWDGGVASRIGWYNHGYGGHNRGNRSNTGDDWKAGDGN